MKKYIISTTLAVLSILALFVINTFPILWVFAVTFVSWMALLVFSLFYYRQTKADFNSFLSLTIFTAISFVILIALLELNYLKYFLILIAGLAIWFIFIRFLETKEMILSYEQKPYRRVLTMLWVFDNYVFIVFGFALSIFFPLIPFWLISILVGLVVGYISTVVWQMYFDIPLKSFLLRAVIMTLIISEVIWVMHFLPLGYLSLGALIAWLWYLLLLFNRFQMGKQGIIWRKQIVFLFSNLLLYFLVLYFFVRWI